MYAAITIAALMNVYWMWLIVKQLARVIQRLTSGGTFSGTDTFGDEMEGAK